MVCCRWTSHHQLVEMDLQQYNCHSSFDARIKQTKTKIAADRSPCCINIIPRRQKFSIGASEWVIREIFAETILTEFKFWRFKIKKVWHKANIQRINGLIPLLVRHEVSGKGQNVRNKMWWTIRQNYIASIRLPAILLTLKNASRVQREAE